MPADQAPTEGPTKDEADEAVNERFSQAHRRHLHPGAGQNFYHPTYVKIGRALVERGYICITANTRLHDIGFNVGERKGKGRACHRTGSAFSKVE